MFLYEYYMAQDPNDKENFTNGNKDIDLFEEESLYTKSWETNEYISDFTESEDELEIEKLQNKIEKLYF